MKWSAQTATWRVLLIGGNPELTNQLTELLEDSQTCRYYVETCSDLNTALDALAEMQPDVVLLDLTHPNSVGGTALERVRASAPPLPVIVVAGDEAESLARRTLRHGALDYLIIDTLTSDLLSRSIRYAIERRASEAKLQAATQELVHSNKMEALGRLAGGVAHDFNNALTTISGYGWLLREGINEDDPRRPEVEEILKAVNHATGLTRRLLEFSRKRGQKRKLLDLNTLMGDMKGMLQPLLGEDVELIVHEELHLYPVMADRSAMEQIIMNLALNARDAMPDGGIITVGFANKKRVEARQGGYIGNGSGPHVEFSVTDTGTGIDPKVIEDIFDPFFTTKNEGQGTGLGLSTVYGLVQQNDGHISVYSEPGLGTCFKVFLPGVTGTIEAPPHDAPELDGLHGTETVLIVEDDLGLLAMVRSFLEKMHYNLIVASNGRRALEECSQFSEKIDLVLCDLVLPDCSGPEIMKKLRAERPELKAVYMSAYTEAAIKDRGLLQPETDFISKPFTIEAVGKKIRDALQ